MNWHVILDRGPFQSYAAMHKWCGAEDAGEFEKVMRGYIRRVGQTVLLPEVLAIKLKGTEI